MNNINLIIRGNVLETQLNYRNDRLASLKSSLLRTVQDIDETKKIEYTEWYVLMKRDGERWISACYCPLDDDDGDKMPFEDFEVILPIPKPETLREFDGF